MRLFVAIELPDSTRRSLGRLAAPLQRVGISGRSLICAENLHLTLKFLGEVPDERIGNVCDVLRRVPSPSTIRLELDRVQCLPERGPVRIVCVGLVGQVDRLEALYEEIESSLGRAGFRKEGRRFRPHITVARLRPTLPVSARPSIEALPPFQRETAAFQVPEFVLMQSYLEPGGARYIPAARFPFGTEI